MTDVQLYMAIGVPMLFNFLLFTAFMTMVNRQMDQQKDLWRAELGRHEANMEIRFGELRTLIERNQSEMLARFSEIDARLNRLENERRILQ
jgi:hypothetical protein